MDRIFLVTGYKLLLLTSHYTEQPTNGKYKEKVNIETNYFVQHNSNIKPFQPVLLPPENLDEEQHRHLSIQVRKELARFDRLLQKVPKPQVLLAILARFEAIASTNMKKFGVAEKDDPENVVTVQRDMGNLFNCSEVNDYQTALKFGQQQVMEHRITNRGVRNIHQQLLKNDPDSKKKPGYFRKNKKEQNYLHDGLKIYFYPPAPRQVSKFMDNWEQYAKREDVDCLLQLAVMQAQFENIHPFMDGNGRTARILIPLSLYKSKVISLPMFYISTQLYKHQQSYYQKLTGIREEDNWNSWVEFLLGEIASQATYEAKRIEAIRHLYVRTREQIQEFAPSQYVDNLLDAIFIHHVLEPSKFRELACIPEPTAQELLQKLVKHEILQEYKNKNCNKELMIFTKLFHIKLSHEH